MKPLVIVGSGGHGRVVMETADASAHPIHGFVDSTKPGGTLVNGVPVIAGNEILDDTGFLDNHTFIVAIGDQAARRRLSLRIKRGGILATIVHPSCIIAPSARIGSGTVLVAGSIVNANAVIGDFCILNTGCSVDHDGLIADGVQVCPGARLAGNVSCEEDAFIGTGAVVIPRVSIGAAATVGAGAVVTKNVPPGETWIGNPARRVATRLSTS